MRYSILQNLKMTPHTRNNTTRKIPLLVLTIGILLGLLIFFIPSSLIPVSWDFRNNLWGPVYLLTQNQSPYNIHEMFANSNAVWMPSIFLICLFLGYLPLQWASNLWVILINTCMFLLVYFIAKESQKTWKWLFMMVIMLVLFPATMTHLFLGQVSLLVTLLLFLLVKYHQKIKPYQIGFLLVISLVKPQLLTLFLPTYIFIYYRERGNDVFKMAAYVGFWIVVLLLPIFIMYPGWLPDFFQNLSINPSWLYPNLFSLLRTHTGSSYLAILFSFFSVLCGIIISITIYLRSGLKQSLLWALALTPIFSPIVWSWDFVLIFPLLLSEFARVREQKSTRFLYTGYFLCVGLYLLLKVSHFVDDQITIWVPFFLVGIILLSRTIRKVPQKDEDETPLPS